MASHRQNIQLMYMHSIYQLCPTFRPHGQLSHKVFVSRAEIPLILEKNVFQISLQPSLISEPRKWINSFGLFASTHINSGDSVRNHTSYLIINRIEHVGYFFYSD